MCVTNLLAILAKAMTSTVPSEGLDETFLTKTLITAVLGLHNNEDLTWYADVVELSLIMYVHVTVSVLHRGEGGTAGKSEVK